MEGNRGGNCRKIKKLYTYLNSATTATTSIILKFRAPGNSPVYATTQKLERGPL